MIAAVTMRPRVLSIRIALAFAALAPLAAGGCSADLEQARGAESVLDIWRVRSAGPPPAELAQMAVDRYDANRRYIGTLGLASAYFAGGPAFLALFEDNADDTDPAVRSAAIRGLSMHGEPRHVPILVQGLTDADKQVRLEAARGLQRLHDPVAVEGLLAATKEPARYPPQPDEEEEPDIRAEAAVSLGQYAQPRVVEALIAAVRDDSLAVNRAALSSLRTLTGQDFGLDHDAWVAWRDQVNPAEMFTARSLYLYPAFSRSRRWWEYLPLIPRPANEPASTPSGMPRNDS